MATLQGNHDNFHGVMKVGPHNSRFEKRAHLAHFPKSCLTSRYMLSAITLQSLKHRL